MTALSRIRAGLAWLSIGLIVCGCGNLSDEERQGMIEGAVTGAVIGGQPAFVMWGSDPDDTQTARDVILPLSVVAGAMVGGAVGYELSSDRDSERDPIVRCTRSRARAAVTGVLAGAVAIGETILAVWLANPSGKKALLYAGVPLGSLGGALVGGGLGEWLAARSCPPADPAPVPAESANTFPTPR